MKLHTPARRRSTRPILAQAVEGLEKRLAFDAAFAPLATRPLIQDWSDTGLITTNDVWSGVSSINGYRGDNLASSGADPQTVLIDTNATTGTNPIDVNANITSPTFNTGGVSEFELANPTIGLSGSGTADASNLVINLDTTGVTDVRVRYTLRDLENGTDNATQRVALQYRIGTTGTFTNVPAAYVADATTGPSTNGPDIPVDVLLSGIGGQAQVQLRIITADAAGNDENVGVDDLYISNAVAPVGAGTFSLSAASLATVENAGTYNVIVYRLDGATGPASVDFALAAGTAATPGDFAGPGGGLTGTVNFVDGQLSAVIPVTIVQNTVDEAAKNLTVTLSNPTNGAGLGTPAQATLTINDDDVAGQFNFGPTAYTVDEPAGTITLSVRRTGGTSGAVTVNYATSDGTATGGSDFTATTAGTVSFADGVNLATITVPILNDALGEPTETFTVTLTGIASGPGATIGTSAAATVTVTDEDARGTLSFDPATYTVAEGAGTFAVTVRRTGGTIGAVTADYAILDGTATATNDFTGPGGTSTGTVSFADGVDTATIQINVVDDALVEGSEAFSLSLANPTGGAALGTTSASVTLTDNDAAAPATLLLNEVHIDPPGSNVPYQFIELRGTPGAVLDSVYLLSVEGDSASNVGLLDEVIDLTGATIGSNGLLMIRSASGFAPQDPATGVFDTPVFNVGGLGLETGSNSFLLVFRDPSGAALPARGTDLDPDNAAGTGRLGTLDNLPASVTLLDAVGSLDGNTSDVVYGVAFPAFGTNASPNAADAFVRFPADATPLSTAAFYYGSIVNNGTTTDSQSITFGTAANQRSANFPEGGIVTPGGVNLPAPPSDTIAPTVAGVAFDPRQGQKLVVTFSEDVSASLAAGDFTLTNATTGQTVSLVMGAVAAEGTSVTLTFANTGGLNANGATSSSVLTDGSHVLKVRAGQVADAAGNALAADSDNAFGFLNADFDVNGTVGFPDLVALAQNYGQAGATYVRGDANYDGTVDFADLVALAQRYGTNTPTANASVALVAAPTTTTAGRSTKKATTDSTAAQLTATPAPKAPAKAATFNSGRRIG